LNPRQTIFWSILAAVIAAVAGVLATNALTKGPSNERPEILYNVGFASLPEKACDAIFETPSCSVAVVKLRNPSFNETGDFEVALDFRDALRRPFNKVEFAVPPSGYPFAEGEVDIISSGEFTRTVKFDRFPALSSAQVEVYLQTGYGSTVRVESDEVNLIDSDKRAEESNIGTLFVVFLLGLLILPFFAALVIVVKWINKS